jgi:hypothetical protein
MGEFVLEISIYDGKSYFRKYHIRKNVAAGVKAAKQKLKRGLKLNLVLLLLFFSLEKQKKAF